jgi:hypothetical protein
MAKDSRGVVIEALAGNGSIALAKSAAAWITGSTAIFTEAIHSPLARRRPTLLYAPVPPDRERRDLRPALPTNKIPAERAGGVQ